MDLSYNVPSGAKGVVKHSHRQAIQTKYLAPTNHRGARVKVWCQAKRVIVAWKDALDIDQNHANAARVLLATLGWAGVWRGGATPDDTGYVFVQTKEEY